MFVNYKLEELNVDENERKYLVSTNKQSFAGLIICCFLKFSKQFQNLIYEHLS